MRDIKDLTTEEITALVNDSFDFHKIDSEYSNMGEVLYALAANCELALRECPECLDTDVEKANFKYLRNILETCADMMLDCDDYFRSLK